jgi:hypothetical protein
MPSPILYQRWRQYREALKAKGELALAKARGDFDGRRDNRRVFSREEEAELKAELGQENVHPNKPVVGEIRLRIHKEHEKEAGPTEHTRMKTQSAASFVASDRFVHRVKRAIKQSDKAVKVRRRYKRLQPSHAEEQKEQDSSQYQEDVDQAVDTYGAAYTINADEISAKIINPPLTLSQSVGSGQRPAASHLLQPHGEGGVHSHPRHDCSRAQAASCVLRAGQD